jgi:NADH:ubiquinone oxidoreductase subunit 4 (subunit M)
LGERKDSAIAFGSLVSSDKWVLYIICFAIVAFGVYPKPLNDLAEEGTKVILTYIK